MVNPRAIEKARQGKRHALDALYAIQELDHPWTTTDTKMAEQLRVDKQDIRNLRLDLVATGSLRTRMTSIGSMRGVEWTLLDTKEVARGKLVAFWLEQDRKTEELMALPRGQNRPATAPPLSYKPPPESQPVATASSSTREAQPDQTVHVAGETVPHQPFLALGSERYDEPRALVEAARQFAGLHREVDKRLKELEALGIQINRETVSKTFQLPRDPRLASVAEALPYIEHLERSTERLGNQVADLRQKLGNLPELQTRLNRLAAQNERLVADKVALEARLRDRPGAMPTPPRPQHANGSNGAALGK